jgi:hypothetical protein
MENHYQLRFRKAATTIFFMSIVILFSTGMKVNAQTLLADAQEGTNSTSVSMSKIVTGSEVNEPSVIVYPNTFVDEINVVLEDFGNELVTIEICDAQGKIILIKELNTNNTAYHTQIDVKNLNPAVYNLSVKSANHIINRKINKKEAI